MMGRFATGRWLTAVAHRAWWARSHAQSQQIGAALMVCSALTIPGCQGDNVADPELAPRTIQASPRPEPTPSARESPEPTPTPTDTTVPSDQASETPSTTP